MYQQAEKPKENKSRAVANSVSQKKSTTKEGFGFVDNRPGTIAQRKVVNNINAPLQRAVDFSGQVMSSMQQVAQDDETWEFYKNLDSETKTLFRDFVSDNFHTVQHTTFLKWMATESKKTASEVIAKMHIELSKWYNGVDDVSRTERFDTGYNGNGGANAEVSPETLAGLKTIWKKENFRIPPNTNMREAWSRNTGTRTGDRMHDFLVENTSPHKALFNFHIEVKRK